MAPSPGYVVKRIARSVVLLLCVSLVTFLLIRQAPGGPAILANPGLSKAQVQNTKENLGLNDPIFVQYGKWIGNVAQGDLGVSYNEGVEVTSLIEERLPSTLLLVAVALLLGVVFGVLLGVLAAVKKDTWIDHMSSGFAILNVSVPPFYLGILLILVFAVELRWLPVGGMGEGPGDTLKHLILPAIVSAAFMIAVIARFTRATMLDVMQQTYVVYARAKGLPMWRVILGYGLRNSLVPLITVIATSIPALVGTAAIVEQVFAWPGVGRTAITAAVNGDYPTIMGITLVMSVIVIAVNLVADLSYGFADPRVRLGASK